MFDFIKRYKAWIVVVVLIVCIVLFHDSQEKKKSARMLESEKRHSISVLPPGIEEEWMSYLKKRFSEEIQREGNSLRVRESYIGEAPTYSYVSLNHPYEIDCNSFLMGFSVFFPSSGDEGIGVNLTGDFSSDYKNEPEIGIPIDSIAADKLNSALCKHLSLLMEDIVFRGPQ